MYTQNNTGKLKNDKQGTYLHRRIKIYVTDPIVMKKDDDNRSCFLKVSCHTKFRFSEREAQCILRECGPLTNVTPPFDSLKINKTHINLINCSSVILIQVF